MNLNTASPIELQNYKMLVAGTLNIDPMMLDFIDITNAQGYGTDKVLYAKRGAAEVLRKNLGINVTSLVQSGGDGWVTYTATGTDKSGRQEIAVGAAYVRNVHGDKLAHAFMTAQTRAVRRLTLQFVTGGVLDESEVQTQDQFTQAPAATGAALAGSPMVVPPPVVPPAPITRSKDDPRHPIHFPNIAPVIVEAANSLTDALVADIKPLVDAYSAATSAPEAAQTISEIALTLPESTISAILPNGTNAPSISPEPPKKTRKPRVKKDFGDAPVQTTIPPGMIDAQGIITPAEEAIKQAAFKAQQEQLRADAQAALAAKPSTPVTPSVQTELASVVEMAPPAPAQVQAAPLTSDQKASFTDRAKHYYNDVLPEGGMMPTDGIGGVTMKFRKFAQVHTGAKTPALTSEQFESLFAFLDAFTEKFGAAALVAYMDKTIGVTQ